MRAITIIAIALTSIAPAVAHHSDAGIDMEATVTLEVLSLNFTGTIRTSTSLSSL